MKRTVLAVIEQERVVLSDGTVKFVTNVAPDGGRSVYQHVHVGTPGEAEMVDAVVTDMAAKLVAHDARAVEFATLADAKGDAGVISYNVLDSHIRILGPAKWELLTEWDETAPDGSVTRREHAIEADDPAKLPSAAEVASIVAAQATARADALVLAQAAADFAEPDVKP